MSWEISEESSFYLLRRGIESFKIEKRDFVSSYNEKIKKCYGIWGISPLLCQKYLVVITKVSLVDFLQEKTVYKINNLSFFPLEKSEIPKKDLELMQIINNSLEMAFLYFSPEIDLTQNEQSITKGRKTDPRFFVNKAFSKEFDHLRVSHVISGFIASSKIEINEEIMNIVIISRRETERLGMRFWMRGCDVEGNSANFVETETIIEIQGKKRFSMIQTRGSLPFLWKQEPDLKCVPKVQFPMDMDIQTQVFDKHIAKMKKLYGGILILSLIDRKRVQGRLGEFLERIVQNSSLRREFKYHWFELNKKCSKVLMKLEKMELLLGELDSYLTENNGSCPYFSYDISNSKVEKLQNIVIRTNCMDSLDRTNITQTVISTHIFRQVLKESLFGLDVERKLKRIWWENGNALSQFIAGTDSLKSDVLMYSFLSSDSNLHRKGKLSIASHFNDVVKIGKRYFYSNFRDSEKQAVFFVVVFIPHNFCF